MRHSQSFCILLVLISLVSWSGILVAEKGEYPHTIVPGNSLPVSNEIVSLPAEILVPGVYQLKKDAYEVNSSAALIIRSDDIVLEGNGSTISEQGENSSQTGGILIHIPDRIVRNITLSNLTVSGFQSGITVDNAENITVKACIISENTVSGIRMANVSGCRVIETEILANKPPEGEEGGAGIQISGSEDIEICNSRIWSNGRGNGGDGISISDSSGIVIGKNTISENTGTGIKGEVLVSGLIIRENSIYSNSKNGITLVSCRGPVVADNYLSENVMAAIDISSCSKGILSGNKGVSGRVGLDLAESEEFSLHNNDFRKNSINIDITGSSPVMFNHAIDSSNMADNRPVRYLLNAHGVSISSSDNPSCIYAVNSSGLTIYDLVLSKNGAGVFLVNSHNVTISGMAVLDNAFGIRIGYGSSDVRISSTSAESNLIAGYAVTSSDNITFDSCSAQKNLAGFFLSGSENVTCFDCHAEKQQGLKKRGPSGFQISECKKVFIINSTSEKNPFDGIYLKDSPGTNISATELISNDVAGIAVLSEDVFLSGNRVSSNKAAGVLLYGNGSTLEGNRITANSGRGLLFDETTGIRVWNNYFNNSKNTELTGTRGSTIWNITPRHGLSVTGRNMTGGNYWSNPEGTGYSDTCVPDRNGFCDTPFTVGTGDIDYYPLASREFSVHSSDNETPTESSLTGSDLNRNGREDLHDVVLLMEIVSDNNTRAEYDISGDGIVNYQDVVALFIRISD